MSSKPFTDVHGILNEPSHPNCIQWSEDGTLAIAAGNSITLLHPGNMPGPRAFIGIDSSFDTTILNDAGQPTHPRDSINYDLTNMRVMAMTASYVSLTPVNQARSIAWSPSGCGNTGSCLLAAVTIDHKVMIYAPPDSLKSGWQEVCSVTELFQSQLNQTNWSLVLSSSTLDNIDNTNDGEQPLRLRGGAPKRGRPSKAKAVDNQEDNEDDELAAKQQKTAAPGGTSRRKKVAPRAAPTDVDPYPSSPPEVKATGTGRPKRGQAGKETAAAAEGPPKSRQAGARKKAQQQESGPSSESSSSSSEDESTDEDVPAAGPAAAGEGEDDDGGDVFELPEYIATAVDTTNTKTFKATAPSAVVRMFLLSRDKLENRATYESAGQRLKGVDENLFNGCLSAAQKKFGTQLAEAGLDEKKFANNCREALRKYWDRTTDQVLKGFSLNPSLAPASDKKTTKTAKASGRRQSKATAETEQDEQEDDEDSDDEAGPSNKAGRKKKAPVDEYETQPYQVPEGFSSSDLPAIVTFTDASTKRTMLEAAVKRFLRLRKEVPEDELPKYAKKSLHLVGKDLHLVSQVTCEFWSVYEEEIKSRVKFSSMAEFQAGWLARLRVLWDRSKNACQKNFDFEAEEDPTNALPRPQWSKPKSGGTQKAQPAASPYIAHRERVSDDDYNLRLPAVSALAVSWSPTYRVGQGEATKKVSFLAVGTKGGRVWIWKYTHPDKFTLKSPANKDAEQEQQSSYKQQFTLLGSILVGDADAWVCTLAWENWASSDQGDVAILSVGLTNGSASIWGAAAQSLATASSAEGHEPLLERWSAPIPVDDRPVTSISLKVSYSLDNTNNDNATAPSTAYVVLAVGKSMGIVSTWTSLPIKPEASYETFKNNISSQDIQHTTPIPDQSVFGSDSITGLAWMGGGRWLAACSRSGTFMSWKAQVTGKGSSASGSSRQQRQQKGDSVVLKLTETGVPPACGRRKSKESGVGAFGLAASPGGRFVGIVRPAFHPAAEFVKQQQIHQRLILGFVQLHRCPVPLESLPKESSSCINDWVHHHAAPAALWDSILLLRLAGSSSKHGPLPEVAQLASNLENSAFQELETVGLSKMSLEAWRRLKAASSLRHAFLKDVALKANTDANATKDPKEEDEEDGVDAMVTEENDVNTEALKPDAWAIALEKDEVTLLQRQLITLLSDTSSPDSQSRALVAADWVTLNVQHPHVHNQVIELAPSAYLRAGEGLPSGHTMPLRQRADSLGGKHVGLSGLGITAATAAVVEDEGVTVELSRCPASLELCESVKGWACRVCDRKYKVAVGEEKGGGPCCVLCGGLVGKNIPSTLLLAPPCM